MFRIATTLVCLLCVFSVFAHEPILLDSRRATPGTRLEMIELPRSKTSTSPTYRLKAVGFPRGVVVNVWGKDFGHSFHELASGFHVDEGGNLFLSELKVAGQPQRLDEVTFTPGPYPSGAIWEVGLVSEDRTLKAFAKAIPYPITLRDGPCTLSLELVSQRGERFLASGSGFDPAEEVVIESRYATRVIENRARISADGLLPPQVIIHGATGDDRSAHYTVQGRSCKVIVDYEWGEPALVRHQ